MALSYADFLARIISDGIAAASESYKNSAHKLEGAIAGFKACAGKTPPELVALFTEAVEHKQAGMREQIASEEYWRRVTYAAEIEWVCNVVSAARYNQGLSPLLSWQPTARGVLQAAKILGIAGLDADFGN